MKINVDDLKHFDAADFINDAEDVLHYLNVVLEENDPAALAEALGTIAKSEGMSKISESTGISREALYKALKPESKPRFETLSKVANSLGFKFVLEPINKPHEEVVTLS